MMLPGACVAAVVGALQSHWKYQRGRGAPPAAATGRSDIADVDILGDGQLRKESVGYPDSSAQHLVRPPTDQGRGDYVRGPALAIELTELL